MNTIDYKHIERLDPQDDENVNVILRNGKRILIEVDRLGTQFKARLFHFAAVEMGLEKKKSILTDLSSHDEYKECVKEALGWIDDHAEKDLAPELFEIKK